MFKKKIYIYTHTELSLLLLPCLDLKSVLIYIYIYYIYIHTHTQYKTEKKVIYLNKISSNQVNKTSQGIQLTPQNQIPHPGREKKS